MGQSAIQSHALVRGHKHKRVRNGPYMNRDGYGQRPLRLYMNKHTLVFIIPIGVTVAAVMLCVYNVIIQPASCHMLYSKTIGSMTRILL